MIAGKKRNCLAVWQHEPQAWMRILLSLGVWSCARHFGPHWPSGCIWFNLLSALPPRTLYHQLGMEARARYQELHTWKCCIASGANPLCLTTNAIICNSRLLQSITAIFQWSDIDLAEVAPIFFAQLDDLDGVDGCGWCVAQLPLFRRRTSLRYLVSQFTWHQMHQVRQSSHDNPVNPACTISSKSNWYVDSSTLNHVWEVLLFQASTDLYWRTGMQWISVTPAHSEMLQNVADLTWSDMSWKCIRNHKNGSQEIGRPWTSKWSMIRRDHENIHWSWPQLVLTCLLQRSGHGVCVSASASKCS